LSGRGVGGRVLAQRGKRDLSQSAQRTRRGEGRVAYFWVQKSTTQFDGEGRRESSLAGRAEGDEGEFVLMKTVEIGGFHQPASINYLCVLRALEAGTPGVFKILMSLVVKVRTADN